MKVRRKRKKSNTNTNIFNSIRMAPIVKQLLLVSVYLGLFTSISAQAFTKIEFNSQTRGYQKSVVFEKSTVHFVLNSISEKKDTTFPIAKKDWLRLHSLVKNMPLKDLPDWKGSTEGSATDRALASTITIVTKNNTYTSQTFDNYQAPKKLLPIMAIVRKYSQSALSD